MTSAVEETSTALDWRPWHVGSMSLRTQLLLAVNIPLAGIVALFLGIEFRRELASRFSEKEIALKEEAKLMLPAVLQIQHHGDEVVQSYIDSVCARIENDESPGHHIVVVLQGEVLQASAHHELSPSRIAALQKSTGEQSDFAFVTHDNLVVGASRENGASVFVSEQLDNVRRSVWSGLRRRIVGAIVIGGLAAIVVNIVLFRFVSTPVTRLIDTVRAIAAGNVGCRLEDRFASSELRFLAEEINQMSDSLAKADKYRRLQMSKARKIQHNILPSLEDRPGMTISSLFIPADEVGGDYFDLVDLSDGTTLLYVADVTGHGISAAMSTALLRSLLRTAAERFCRPAEIADFVNRRFLESTLPEDFATAILIRIDINNGLLEYLSAGHETAWLLSPDGTRRGMESGGLILGIDADAQWETGSYEFHAGDRLLIVTDGVTETYAATAEEFYGRERPVELLEQCAHSSVQRFTERLNDSLTAFRQGGLQADDVTVVITSFDA